MKTNIRGLIIVPTLQVSRNECERAACKLLGWKKYRIFKPSQRQLRMMTEPYRQTMEELWANAIKKSDSPIH